MQQQWKTKSQPQVTWVDPNMIKFNPSNPRRHRGLEYLRLKKSVQDVGYVQLPTVRVLPGGFLECIDGEGRVKAAQEAHIPNIAVVNFGIVDEQDALTMLQSANTIRSFDLLAECRGFAELHRQGKTIKSLSEKFDILGVTLRKMIDIGYFPDNIYQMIMQDMEQSEEKTHRWTFTLLSELLPLRQERSDTRVQRINDESGAIQIDETRYDYREVHHAVEKVIRGSIESGAQMTAYVAQRRLEIFQERFDQRLQSQLEEEIALAKDALHTTYLQEREKMESQTKEEYAKQIEKLQNQLGDLEKRHRELINEVAKRPEIVEARERELKQKLSEAEEERRKLIAQRDALAGERSQIEEERIQKERELQAKATQMLQEERVKQRVELEKEYKSIRRDLEDTYNKRVEQHELKVARTIQQAMSHGIEALAEVQQSLLLLMTPDYVREITLMQMPEKVSLLAQIKIVRDTLEKAEERLVHGDVIFASGNERRHDHGYAPE